METNVKVLAAVIAASLNLILIIIISLRNRKHIVYRSFLLISFCLLLWNTRVIISSLMVLTENASFPFILISHLFYPIVTACLYILPVATLQFTISFIGYTSRTLRDLIRAAYIMAFGLSVVYASGILSNRTYDIMLWLFLLPLFAGSLLLLGRAYYHARRPLERTRFGLLLVGGTIGVAGAIIEDILADSAINAGGIGNIANATYSLLVAICLFKHRLFDVSLTLRRTTSIGAVALSLLLVTYLLSNTFGLSNIMPYGHLFVAALLLLILGNRIIPYAEHILFRKSTHVYQTLDDIRYALDKAQNITQLFRITMGITKKNIAITKCFCVAYDEFLQKYRYYWHEENDISGFVSSDRLTDFAKLFNKFANAEPLVYDEICHELNFGTENRLDREGISDIKESMERIQCEVFAPVFLTKPEGAILLGEKDNGQAFNESDMQFLKILTYSCGLRLQQLRMLERVRQLEELAALGEMAAYVAHEVKNPITIIRSSAQLMESGHHDPATSNMIIEECDRLNRVVTQMLHFAKSPKPNLQQINIEKEVRALVKEITQSLESRNIRLRLECVPNLPRIKFDADHLKQVIMNLLLNAMEAIKGSGQILISITDNKDRLELAISDSGPGIGYADQHEIFQPFYSTKPGSSGLGLPITRRLLEMNNGVIEIDSLPGKGCTFKISLPLWSE